VFKKIKKIDFTNILNVDVLYSPYPTKKNIPDWYKKTQPFYDNKNILTEKTSITIKKCIPVLDAMTMGYIITTYCDLYINYNYVNKNDLTKIEIDTNSTRPKIVHSDESIQGPIEFHEINQLKDHPLSNNKDALKFMNAWSIKTPPGYSCLFINPMHNPSKIFTILEGVVDTDKYNNIINFPFILKDENFSGIIPAGTPIAQVIPFKRDLWKIKINKKEKNILKARQDQKLIKSVFSNSYKKNFWSRKEYN